MGKIQKKYEKGAAAAYISRGKALKKLQLSLKDFRRLCILKGIYPHEPKHKKKVNKGGLQNRTWYYVKDINFLAHEPIINKFREYKIYLRKLKKAVCKKEGGTARRLRENRPKYSVDHIVRERYPTFTDAVRDLDDALCMAFLFCRMARSRVVPSTVTQLCSRLSSEFMLYVIESRSLRKVFVSIKGIYYQADILGNTVTWIVPHDRCLQPVTDVDFVIMTTFVEFYVTMLGFINFKLYSNRGLIYPPQLAEPKEDNDAEAAETAGSTERIYAMSRALEKISDCGGPLDDAVPDEFPQENMDEDERRKEQDRLNRLSTLFNGLKIFLSREVPRQSLAFVIRCFGGEVSWDESDGDGSTFLESDQAVTHQIVDRTSVEWKHPSRFYIQPQWIYDSVNARMLLPVEDYYPGSVLPAHLSPFVDEAPDEYLAPEKVTLLKMQGRDVVSDDHLLAPTTGGKRKAVHEKAPAAADQDQGSTKNKKMRVNEGRVAAGSHDKQVAEQAEQRKLQEMVIAKRYRRAYHKIKHGQKTKAQEVRKLKEKRRLHDEGKKNVVAISSDQQAV